MKEIKASEVSSKRSNDKCECGNQGGDEKASNRDDPGSGCKCSCGPHEVGTDNLDSARLR
jgi:hypothetical protein